jgi:hypothetical protein
MPRNTVLFLLSAFLGVSIALSHEDWVHQHIVREAYSLLSWRIGQVPVMQDHVGTTQQGDGQFNPGGLIVIGAYQEDHTDAVFGYGGPFNLVVSSTHFWDPDFGDGSKFQTHPDMAVYENAYFKAQKYIYGGYEIQVYYPGNGIVEAYSAPAYLPDFYQNGVIWYKGFYDITGHFVNRGYWTTVSIGFRDRITWEILGRVCHLLADVGTPAHAHYDQHDGFFSPHDIYEVWEGSNYTACTYTSANQRYGWIDSGFPDAYGRANPLKHLFYIAAQLADHFRSNDAVGDNQCGINDAFSQYPPLSDLISMTLPSSMTTIDNNDIRLNALNFDISATAGLLYWFATEAGLLKKVTISTSFGGGTLLVEGRTVNSGYAKGVNSGSSISVTAASTQQFNGVTYSFTGWQLLDANGSLIGSSTNLTWGVAITTKGTLRANYVAPLSATLSGPTNLQWGQTGTYTTTASGGYPPYSYAWWIQYPGGGDILAGGEETEERIEPDAPPPGDTWYSCGANSPNFTHTCYESFGVKCYVTDSHQTTVLAGPRYNYLGGGGAMMAKEGTATIQVNTASLAQAIPNESSLTGIYPNPFNPTTTLRFSLKEKAQVTLAIYDALGREIVTLAKASHGAGYYNYTWNAAAASSGIYLARLTVDTGERASSFSKVTKLLLVK